MRVRAPRSDDLEDVLLLCRAADEAVYGDSDWTEGDLRRDWDDLDLERDAWLVELDGRIAGYGMFEDLKRGRLMGDGYVHPELQGQGVGSCIVDLYEGRAGEIADARTLETAALHGDGAAEALFTSRGFAAVRHFFRMVVEHDAEPAVPEWPGGIVGAPFDREQAADVHAALNESFAHEWGYRPQPFDEWQVRRLDGEGFDPGLSWVAWDGDEVAGLSLNDWKRNGDWGWVASLGVRPPWRRRGLGEALLRASFREFWRRGETTVALGVDVQNPTGTTRLYERVGMGVLWQADVYRKELRRG